MQIRCKGVCACTCVHACVWCVCMRVCVHVRACVVCVSVQAHALTPPQDCYSFLHHKLDKGPDSWICPDDQMLSPFYQALGSPLPPTHQKYWTLE
jgi:hypothetical protein